MQRGTEQSGSEYVGSRNLYTEPDWLKAGDWSCPDEMGVAGSQFGAKVGWIKNTAWGEQNGKCDISRLHHKTV